MKSSSTPNLEHPTRGTRIARIAVEAIAAIFILTFTVPWQPAAETPIGAFDFSWMLLLNDAVATGRQFGKQIILPQGPLGFLSISVYDPRTYWVLIAARSAIALLAFWSLVELGRKLVPHTLLALPWLVAVILLIGGAPDIARTHWAIGAPLDDFFPGCAILLLMNYFLVHGRKLSASAIALIIVLAAASLMKVNQPFYALAVVGVLTIDQIAQRSRYFLLAPVIFLASFLLLYVSARQSLSSLGAFLWGWRQVAFGHADAVGVPGPWTDAAAYLVVVAMILSLVGVYEWKARRFAGALPLAGLAGVLLLLYKHSFMRLDARHVFMGPMVVLAATILWLPAFWQLGGRRHLFRAGGLAVICVAGALLASILPSYTGQSLVDYPMEAPGRCAGNLSAAFSHFIDRDRLNRQWESARQHVRDEVPLPLDKITGTVDVYPHRQDVAFAYGLDYQPRPVVSSLVATSTILADVNAAHLRGPLAPQTILFDVELVDENYPTILDGESLPELLTRYDVIDATHGMLVLRRAPAPRKWRLIPTLTRAGRFNEPIPVPPNAGAPIWAQFHFTKRLAGRLMAAVFKPALVAITVQTADGAENQSYRLLPSLAEQGFLLSPLIKDRAAYARLASKSWAQDLKPAMVDSITITVEDGSQEASFEPEFAIELKTLEFEHQPSHLP